MKWPVPSRGHGCEHARAFKQEEPALDNLTKAVQFLRLRNPSTSLHCLECRAYSWLHVCLHCVYVGCFRENKHLRTHATTKGHCFSLETQNLQIFCAKCNDYIYDQDFLHVIESERCECANQVLPQDTARATYVAWQPQTKEEHDMLSAAIADGRLVDTSTTSGLGLRGLSNLGNTCFTNCILQAMAHNPLLRNYFLSGLHQRELSRVHSPAAAALPLQEGERVRVLMPSHVGLQPAVITALREDGQYDVRLDITKEICTVPAAHIRCTEVRATTDRGECLACVTASLFSEVYSGMTKCFAPHRLLHAVWQNSKHLAGYAQQDAHEFFIAMLDGLHSHCETARDAETKGTCGCIIHRVFTGDMQSDVACTHCGNVSTTIEPFWDISVDVRQPGDGPLSPLSPVKLTVTSTPAAPVAPAAPAPAPTTAAPAPAPAAAAAAAAVPASPAAAGATVETLTPTSLKLDGHHIGLIECLRRFTRTEQLGANHKVFCKTCDTRTAATKRLSVQRLPLVLCIQLKRFQQRLDGVRKIDTHVDFPETLDMRPFLSDPHGPGTPDDACRYTLFAVVNHSGPLDSGHYTCYVRMTQQGDSWFLCNDETITTTDLPTVLASQGYMLFFVKNRLEYASS